LQYFINLSQDLICKIIFSTCCSRKKITIMSNCITCLHQSNTRFTIIKDSVEWFNYTCGLVAGWPNVACWLAQTCLVEPIDRITIWIYHHKISLNTTSLWDHMHNQYAHILLGLVLIKWTKIPVAIKISTHIIHNSSVACLLSVVRHDGLAWCSVTSRNSHFGMWTIFLTRNLKCPKRIHLF
jgi:hypothetical protein